MLDRMIAALEDYAQVTRGAVTDLNATVEVDTGTPAEQEAAPNAEAEARGAGAHPKAESGAPASAEIEGATPEAAARSHS
jgi:hypothetical protein